MLLGEFGIGSTYNPLIGIFGVIKKIILIIIIIIIIITSILAYREWYVSGTNQIV